MVVNEIFENYTLVAGFVLNNALFEVLNMTGLTVLPFIYAVMSNVVSAKRQGDDEGDPAELALKMTEMDFLRMIPIAILLLMPSGSEVTTNGAAVPTGICNLSDDVRGAWQTNAIQEATGSSAITSITVAGGQARGDENKEGAKDITPAVPLGIELVHNVSSGITATVAATLPCGPDLRVATLQFNDMAIQDAALQQFAGDFIQQCFIPASNRLMSSGQSIENPEVALSITGEAIYNQYALPSGTPMMNVKQTFFIDNLDLFAPSVNPTTAINNAHQQANGDFEASCIQSNAVLRNLLLKEAVMQSLWDGEENQPPEFVAEVFGYFVNDDDSFDPYLPGVPVSAAEKNRVSQENLVINKMMGTAASSEMGDMYSIAAQNGMYGDNDFNNGGVLHKTGAMIGDAGMEIIKMAGAGLTTTYSAMEASIQKQINPILLAIVQMLFYAMIPLLLVSSGYSGTTALTIIGVTFGLEFMNAVFALAVWIDDTLMDLVFNNLTFFEVYGSAAGMITIKIGYMCHNMLPFIYMGILGIGGISLNSMAGTSMKAGGQAASSVGSKGVGVAKTAASAGKK